jgi:MoaA/NifB/PqqE/SkfB family radical SAM enzyme
MFAHIEIETASMCNRKCETCLRQNIPDKALIQPWHERHLMPMETITAVFAELGEIAYDGNIYLNHYNEPLLDPRLPQIAKLARQMVPNAALCLHTNGDLMTAEMAGKLDGVLHWLVFSAYDDKDRDEREARMARLFDVTPVDMTHGVHMMTHFYPGAEERAAEFLHHACIEPMRRLILNHRGQMLLCCSDVVGRFDLGTFPERSLVELWNSPKHIEIILNLSELGGREKYEYCRACPRSGWVDHAEFE